MLIALDKILEQLVSDTSDDTQHGICSTCYPTGNESPMYSLCGVDVTGETIFPAAEVTDTCKACTNSKTIKQHLRDFH